MLEWLYHFGLFVAEAAIIVVAIGIVIGMIARQKAQRGEREATLVIRDRGEHFRQRQQRLALARLSPAQAGKAQKLLGKEEKKKAKQQKKQPPEDQKAVWVVDFNGDMRASATPELSEQISALLLAAKAGDEVVVRLESGGGLVHAYGLASSQLDRLRNAELKLTVCVDKVAASGGYMMACCADHLVAAPFAVVGSIGVVAQIPNVHRLLKKNDVDVEVLTAGKHKRTLTMLGENTEEGRDKFLEDLADTHGLFKRFVSDRRPQLAIDDIATGDTWYGSEAVSNGLIDEVGTSEDYLQRAAQHAKVLEISLKKPRSLAQRLGKQSSAAVERGVDRAFERLARLSWEKH
ncbi:protease SohB [Carnimonas bestiolae]|uniref:protease SohB n=1 Tax=Carnimonas bestiolae TaxID=3402172 RepID=UPI003EDBCF8B